MLIEEHQDGDRRHTVPVNEGDLVVFGSRERIETRRGRRRKIPLLHAMDPVTAGEREAIGLVFSPGGMSPAGAWRFSPVWSISTLGPNPG